jgi:ribose transport system ATP-binding protein
VIYQELSVVNTLNVGENIFLGDEITTGPFLRRRAQERQAKEWLERLGADLDTSSTLSGVGNAELQVVEIVKALRREPAVLILDEPTAALTEAEAKRLGGHMRTLREQNLALLFVTHRLAEVFELADRVTVLRGGRVVLSGRVEDMSRADLVAAIAGRSLASDRGAPRRMNGHGASVMRARGLVAPGIGPIDVHVAPGEILGVFGLVGSGRTELLETLFGARPVAGGEVWVGDRRVRLRHPGDAVAAGIALIPSDRLRKSVFPTLSAADNVLLPSFARLSRAGTWRRRGGERRVFAQAATRLNLQPARHDLEAQRFSGGNQQKLVLGRWLESGDNCRVLLLDEPTQGVDVGARSELYRGVRDFVRDGRAAVLTSSEPEELLAVADRVLVLSRGRPVGVLEGEDVTELQMLELAHLGESAEAVAAGPSHDHDQKDDFR